MGKSNLCGFCLEEFDKTSGDPTQKCVYVPTKDRLRKNYPHAHWRCLLEHMKNQAVYQCS